MTVTAKQAITEELRALRKAEGPLNVSKMVHAPAIVKGLGGDDPELALDRLLQLASEHEDDLDIEGAIFTMGHGATTGSVLDRHSEWGALHFMDQRNARRYTDRGIAKLVGLIMGTAPWLQPIATQILRQKGDMVTAQFELVLPPEVAMQRFEVFFNGELQDIHLDRAEPTSHPRSYRSAQHSAFESMLGQSILRLRWRGEKAAEFRTEVHPQVRAHVRVRMARWEMWTYLSDS